MIRSVVVWSRRLAPICCAALLVAILSVGGVEAANRAGAAKYFAQIRETVEAVPYRIGSWVGSDVEPLESAVELLRPNAIMQRRYVEPASGRSVSLLVVHTGDMRDMLGHYPPVCYPAQGWREIDSNARLLNVDGREIPTQFYTFEQIRDGLSQTIQVLSFFVMPSDEVMIVNDMKSVRRVAERRPAAKLGAAQVQLVASQGLQGQEGERLAKLFVQAIEPVVRSVGQGLKDE